MCRAEPRWLQTRRSTNTGWCIDNPSKVYERKCERKLLVTPILNSMLKSNHSRRRIDKTRGREINTTYAATGGEKDARTGTVATLKNLFMYARYFSSRYIRCVSVRRDDISWWDDASVNGVSRRLLPARSGFRRTRTMSRIFSMLGREKFASLLYLS